MRFILVILGVLLVFTGCGEKCLQSPDNTANEYSGIVASSGGNPYFFELETGDGNYGFVVTDETELIWEDSTAIEFYNPKTREDEFNVFGCDMHVTVKAGISTDSVNDYIDVEKWFVADEIIVTYVDEAYFAVDEKPVIYLYPKEETELSVKLDYSGWLSCTYPEYNGQWQITAKPDGTLTDKNGMEYNYLYWEGVTDTEYDFSEGFCIKGEDTAEFLEKALANLGLNRREANEFIVYWLPKMQSNEYNIISFQTDVYTDNAKLEIIPEPDTLIRVFMAYKPSDVCIDITEQKLTSPDREGFTVVEWGGTEIK